MEKILTVVIPTYNMQDYLRRCLDSLIVSDGLMQQLEVLVINDGSKDNSSAIGHEYQEKYPNTFRVVDKENGNYGSCINRALKEATGKYIKVLDADDYFSTDNFSSYLCFLQKHDVDLVLNDFVYIKPDGTILHRYTGRNLPTDQTFSFEKLGADCNIMMHAVAYKRENFKSIRGGISRQKEYPIQTRNGFSYQCQPSRRSLISII